MEELNLFYYKLLSELEKKKAKRSFWVRTILDKKKEKMERKLEKGFINGVNSSIEILKKLKKEFDKANDERELENKERAFIQ